MTASPTAILRGVETDATTQPAEQARVAFLKPRNPETPMSLIERVV